MFLITLCYVIPLILQAWFYSLENEIFRTALRAHFIFFHLTASEGIIAHMKEMKNKIFQLQYFISIILGFLAVFSVWKGSGSTYSCF